MSTHKYPISWAYPIVNNFIEKYARGYNNMKLIFPGSQGKMYPGLVDVLASGNSMKWERLKAVIRTLQTYERANIVKLTPEDRILLYKYLGFSFDDQVIDGEIEI